MESRDYIPDPVDARVSELLTATADHVDPLLHPKVGEALAVLREHMDMDVVFVSQFRGRRRTFRVVETRGTVSVIQAGHSDPLEESWCQRVVEGRVPQMMKDAMPFVQDGQLPDPGFRIGTHISTPLVLGNGEVYGTLCCFSREVHAKAGDLDLRRLQFTAKLLSEELLKSGVGAELELEPSDSRRPVGAVTPAPSLHGTGLSHADFQATEMQKPDFQPTDRLPKRKG